MCNVVHAVAIFGNVTMWRFHDDSGLNGFFGTLSAGAVLAPQAQGACTNMPNA